MAMLSGCGVGHTAIEFAHRDYVITVIIIIMMMMMMVLIVVMICRLSLSFDCGGAVSDYQFKYYQAYCCKYT
jgi:hypothetical protein